MARMHTRRLTTADSDAPSPAEALAALVELAGTDEARSLFAAIRLSIEQDAAMGVEWVKGAQVLHDLGQLDDDEFTYLVMIFTEEMVGTRVFTDPTLTDLMARIEAIEREHGLSEDETWSVGTGSTDWESLQQAWDNEFDRQWAELLRELGEPEIASQMAVGRDLLDAREERGRAFFFGPLEEDGE